MMYRLLRSLTLLVLLITSSLSLFATGPEYINGLIYYFDETTLTASVTLKPNGDNQEACSIPSTVVFEKKHYTVTAIRPKAFDHCWKLKSVTIPSSITSIGSNAFAECYALETININDIAAWCNIEFDGLYSNPLSFAHKLYLNGEKVVDLVIPDTVKAISNNAFYGYSDLVSLTIPSSVVSIGSDSFNGCTGLTSLIIPNSVCSIGSNAFNRCTGLTSIRLPVSLSTINSGVFGNCSNLTSVTIPSSVANIDEEAFKNCINLTSITIPASINAIDPLAFVGCSKLVAIDVNDSNPSYASVDGILYDKSLKELIIWPSGKISVTIPKTITTIGPNAFRGCSAITSITIPSTVTAIGSNSFRDCSAITSINIPSSVAAIGSDAFRGCESLQAVHIDDLTAWCNIDFESTYSNPLSCAHKLYAKGIEVTDLMIPNSVKTIKRYAFASCSNLISVVIPPSITAINDKAFDGCNNLQGVYIEDLKSWCNIKFSSNPLSYAHRLYLNGAEVIDLSIPDSVTYIGNRAFMNCTNIVSVAIPGSVTAVGDEAFYGCTSLADLTISSAVTEIGYNAFAYCSGLTSLIIPDTVINIGVGAFQRCQNLTSLKIGNSVTTIGSDAFMGCKGLTHVTIPNSVITIGGGAFRECGLTSVTIGNSVATIGSRAFQECRGLTSVVLPNSVRSIGELAFIYCSGLKTINIPNSVNEIRSQAFDCCSNLTSITIPNSVKSLGSFAFSGCSSLTSVTLGDLDKDCSPTLIIGEQAFRSCTKIKELTIGNIVENIEAKVFPNILALTKLCVSKRFVLDKWGLPFVQFSYSNLETLCALSPISENLLGEAGAINLKSLTLAFPGVGTIDAFGHFGALFGTTNVSGTRAVIQYFEDGSQKTYYIPTSLEELTIAEGCGMIPYGGLSNCNMLKKLTLPTTLYMVGERALYGCAQLTDIYCHGADPAVAYSNSFDGVRLTSCKLHVPYNSADLYRNAEGWKRFYYIQEEAPIVVNAVANIINAGVIFGLQEYRPGQIAELKAVANSGYTFNGWYEDDVMITTDDTYSFVVMGNRNLVAMFSPVINTNPVTVMIAGTTATLTWPGLDNANVYTAILYDDPSMRNPVAIKSIESTDETVLNRNASERVSVMFDGLSPNSEYYYSVKSENVNGMIISRYDGSFTTGSAAHDDVVSDSMPGIIGYYNMQGVFSDEPWQGVNIAVYSDGSRRKILNR